MIVDELKSKQPIDGNWYISEALPNEGCWKVFIVNDALGRKARLKTVILPDDTMVNEYESKYGKSSHTNDLIIEDLEKQIDVFFNTLHKVKNIQNESIVKIYDFGKFIFSEGYCIYEITEDVTCAEEYYSKTRLNMGMVLKLGQDTANALSICENNSIYHGAVKIENIFTDGSGTYKLGNFGIDALFGNIRLKRTDNYLLAPEEVFGAKGDIASDIYCLGLVLYQLFNFKRTPFMPSKDECYLLPKKAEEQAYQRRMSGEQIPAPMYASEGVADIVYRCCKFEKDERYQHAMEVEKDIEKAIHSENITKVIDYPNFSSFGAKQYQEAGESVSKHNEEAVVSNTQHSYSHEVNEAITKQDNEDENIYTMGAQAYYTEALGSIRNNRHIQADESMLQNIDKVSKEIAEKYGYESKEFKKFVEKLKTLEDIKELTGMLEKQNKKRTNIIKILCGVASLAVVVGVVLLLNTTTYYVNQGQFSRIYKRNLIGATECFKQVPAENLIKDGKNLYYINKDDRKLYRTSTKDGVDESVMTDDSVKMFKISKGNIFYINSSDGNKLYKIDTDSGETVCTYDKNCMNISLDKSDIEIITAEDPSKPIILDTDDLSLKEKLIK